MLMPSGSGRRAVVAGVCGVLATAAIAGCGSASGRTPDGRILAVGAENEYANVISQIGGRYVSATAIMDNPNTDPHTFEASPSVANAVTSARIVVQNGVGYDTFMDKIEAAATDPSRRVIDVQQLLDLPASTPNPHLWYRPGTMQAVAGALARDLSALEPAHAAYFAANARRFDQSLQPWYAALREFRSQYGGTPVATTEPVADYMLRAAGADIRTPFELQVDIMNGVDPAPQSISLQNGLLSGRQVKVFLYNRQVTDSLTQGFLAQAVGHRVPVVGVYETMPTGYDYQGWMLAEVAALRRAAADGVSTRTL